MKIYTRGGDRGQTSLIGKVRRGKDDVRVEAYGTVDEAGAFLGLAVAYLEQQGNCSDLVQVLAEVQQTLWDVGADLAVGRADGYTWRTPADAAAQLEPWIDHFAAEMPAVRQFVLRGGTPAAACLHVACTVVRRAERRTVALLQREPVHEPVLPFLNRLSDLLFVLARVANVRAGRADVTYRHSPEVFR
ncbi:MAG: cob(I)yrinic acid a,c-diamide adenosyltransferase [Alicyclobacillus sp.]|nr:cob(I)yrinic acid a,c-diamide adenosyltransferase [Alicyclobacillus sp.]